MGSVFLYDERGGKAETATAGGGATGRVAINQNMPGSSGGFSLFVSAMYSLLFLPIAACFLEICFPVILFLSGAPGIERVLDRRICIFPLLFIDV